VKVLLDHCVPRPLLRHLRGIEATTARARGWDALDNGLLIARAESEFDVMITADRNIRYQQNLPARKLALIILPTNYTPTVLALAPKIVAALARIQPGGWIEIELPS
jgi:hypothetical protein